MDPGAWTNVGLFGVKPPIRDQFNIKQMQAIPEVPDFNLGPDLGFNEFVLYGQDF